MSKSTKNTAAMRQVTKKEGKCPKCGYKGACELVDAEKGKYPIWFHIVSICCTAGILYLFWKPKKGGLSLLCPECGNIF